MARRVLVLSLGLILILSLSVYGAKKKSGDERMMQRLERIEKLNYADESIVSQYLTTPEPKIFFPATGDTAGFTYYDYQHNDTQRRQIAWDPVNGLVHIDWMNLVGPDMVNNRYVDYNSWDGSSWLAAGGMHVTPAIARAGYCGMVLLPDGREVLYYHRTQPETPRTMWGTTISIERTTPGLGEFDAYDIPDSCLNGAEHGMWPSMDISKATQGDTVFMHITHAEGILTGGTDKQMGYLRCFEKPNAPCTLVCDWPGGGPVQIPCNTRLAPNIIPFITGTARLGTAPMTNAPLPDSLKEARVWLQNYAASQTQNDLYYQESTNNGATWMTPIKLTSYEGTDIRAYDDLATIYDKNGDLHIVWTTFPADNANDVSLWHWSPSTGIRKAGFATAPSTVDPGAWNLLIAKFTLGLYADSNYLYLVYTKFQDGDISAAEFANGDLYVKGSTNGGLTWGPEVPLTNTNTNGCTAGNCLSEHWSSLAEVVDDYLHIEYIEDKDAGGVPQDEGTFTYNAVRYLKYPRPGIPAVPSMAYTPTQFISPMVSATNGGSTGKTMDFDNVGTATLWVNISGPTYVNIAPNNFSIIEAGATQTVNLTFNATTYAETLLIDSLLIASNDGVVGDGQIYADTQWIRFHFVVSDSFFSPEYDTASGPRFSAVVSNIGNIGNQEEGNMMNFDGKDYCFEFTPAFVTPDVEGEGPVGFTWLHEHHDFLAEGHLGPAEDTVAAEQIGRFRCRRYPNIGTIVCRDWFAIPMVPGRIQPLHHLWCEWFGYWTKYSLVIINPRNFPCPNWIRIYNWWRWNPPPPWLRWLIPVHGDPVPGYFGIAADWDVPSDASARNLGGYDETEHLIWQYTDSAGFENHYGGFLWLGASVDGTPETGPFGAHVLTNPTQLYPFGGYDDDSLYKYMSTPGYSIESDSSQDMNIVMSFAEVLSPTESTEVNMEYALIVSNTGESGLRAIATKLKNAKAGDANADGATSVSDVVYLINYLFKGGPEPWTTYSDANGDAAISVSDVVYLINYLFKGGPAPILVWYEEPPW